MTSEAESSRREEEWRELCVEYTRFNAGRALGTAEPSELRVQPIGNALVLVDRARGPLCNRVLHFGAGELPRLPEIVEIFSEAGTVPQFDLAKEDATPEVCSVLREFGLREDIELHYLTVCPSAARPRAVEVRRWGSDRADEFVALLQTSGVKCEPRIWELRRGHYCTESFRTFVAYVDGRPRAWGTSWCGECGDYFANAYTQEEFRGRGCQSALLAARLQDSWERGVTLVVTDVLPNSASERNCRRAGFELAGAVSIWRPRGSDEQGGGAKN